MGIIAYKAKQHINAYNGPINLELYAGDKSNECEEHFLFMIRGKKQTLLGKQL